MANIEMNVLKVGNSEFEIADAQARQDISNLKEELETKANVDGSYDNMTVGNAKQLVATVGITDKVPYNFRTSGGSADIGDREVDKIVGGTVVWNQLVPITASSTTDVTNNGDGSFTVASGVDNYYPFTNAFSLVIGHKYLAMLQGGTGSTLYIRIEDLAGNALSLKANYIVNVSNAVKSTLYLRYRNIAQNTKIIPQLFDLTQMFGSTIADYIYGLEQSQAGAGVAWFRKLFPKPYYAYNAGSLQSVQTSEHKMVGFNQWDEEWRNGYYQAASGAYVANANYICNKNMIPVLPSTTYYMNTNGNQWEIYEYDADGNYLRQLRSAIVDSTFVTDADTHYINIGSHTQMTTYNHDICINLSWDGERDGEYEPYVEYTYPLDDSLTLRGIPKLDSGNNLYYDGDVYEADGTVTRRYGVVDLGTLTWEKALTTGDNYRFRAVLNVKGVPNTEKGNVISTKYPVITGNDSYSGTAIGVAVYSGNGYIFVYDSAYTDAATFKAAMSGVMSVYELATPTTEEADPFTNPQIVDDFGTEEYVDAGVTASTPTRDVAIPVGHETVYQANLRAKLEMAPNSPDGDGDYIVRQTNGENEYVLLEEELPSAPSSDGIYVLKATVASGTATLTWVEET